MGSGQVKGGMGTAIFVERVAVGDAAAASVTLNRPQEGNRLTVEMIRRLTDILTDCAREPSMRAVFLKAAGEDFCCGRDAGSPAGERPRTALEFRRSVAEPILELYGAIREAEVPVVAVVRGAASGLGCALAGACDVTVAAEGARFSLPELRADLPPTLAISALADRVPHKALAYLVYSGAEVDAAEALAIGLVSCVVPDGEAEREAQCLTETLVGASAASLAAAKHYLDAGRNMDPEAAASLAANLLSTVVTSG